MKNSLRFSDNFLSKNLKSYINSYLGNIEHTENIKTVALLTTITTEEKHGKITRIFDIFKNSKYNCTFNTVLPSFFRSYSDVIITKDSYICKHHDPTEILECSKSKVCFIIFKL